MTTQERLRFEVLLEGIETAVGAIAEGHGSLNNKIDQLGRKQDELAAKMEGFGHKLTHVDIKVGKIETDVSVLRSKVVKLEEDVHLIKDHFGLNGHDKLSTAATKPKPKRIKK